MQIDNLKREIALGGENEDFPYQVEMNKVKEKLKLRFF